VMTKSNYLRRILIGIFYSFLVQPTLACNSNPTRKFTHIFVSLETLHKNFP
jgi:hypothetical protein